jgi:hypothetical protein
MPMADDHTSGIRNAVASGEFPRAERLWREYMAGLREQIDRGALSSVQFKEAGELLEWVRLVITCRRAHIQNQLASVQAAGAYLGGPPEPASAQIVQARF